MKNTREVYVRYRSEPDVGGAARTNAEWSTNILFLIGILMFRNTGRLFSFL